MAFHYWNDSIAQCVHFIAVFNKTLFRGVYLFDWNYCQCFTHGEVFDNHVILEGIKFFLQLWSSRPKSSLKSGHG